MTGRALERTGAPPLRIGLAGESTGPGGSEMVMLHLAEGLRARGHAVRGFVPAAGGEWLAGAFAERGVPTDAYALRRAVDPRCVLELARALRRHRLDVLHSHDFTMAIYGALAARLAGVPHVITLHGSVYALGAARRRWGLRAAFASSRAVVAVSGATAEAFVGAMRLPRGSIGVIHNGIPAPAPGDEHAAPRPVEEAVPLILSVGNLRAVKGHLDLIEAAERLRTRHPDEAFCIGIAGEGELRPRLEREIAERGLGDRVRLLGFREDVQTLLRQADVFVMPSHSEGHPLALLESLASGTPVVATRVGGIPEIVEDGRSARLVPAQDPDALAEALHDMLSRPNERAAIAKSGLERFHQAFEVDRMVDRYLALYGDASAD